MKRFILTCSAFFVFFVFFSSILVVVCLAISNSIVDIKVPEDKQIIILGDSHPECAINDEIFTNAINISQSANSYFYSYIKLRRILRANPQIRFVLLGYGLGELANNRDDWFSGEEKISAKMPLFLPFMTVKDLWNLLKVNPLSVMKNLPVALKNTYAVYDQEVRNEWMELKRWGGYRHLNRMKLDEAIMRLSEQKPIKNVLISHSQLKYLKEIYSLCQKEGVTLYLITTPVHPVLAERCRIYNDMYYSVVEEELRGVTLLNHSAFTVKKYEYGDLDHLNQEGAAKYSAYLNKNINLESE